MAYRFDFNRFSDSLSLENLENLGKQLFDYELSVSTEAAHVSSCCCEACEPDVDPEDIDYTNYGLNGYTSGWLDFGALGADHNHDHDGKDSDGPLFAGTADTIAGDSSTTATLAIDGMAFGVRNSATDQDWFQVDLVAGQEYTFFMIRTDVDGVKAHADPELFLFAPDGTTQVGTNDDTPSGGQNSRLTYTATETGTFFLAADGWNTSTGGYVVTASEDNDRVDFTNTQIADFLTDGFSPRSYWDQTTITYNMDGIPDGTGGTDNVQALIIKALEAWAEITGLVFQQVTGTTGDISFIDTEGGAYSSSSTTSNSNGDRTIVSSTINVSQSQWIDNYGDDVNSYSYQTYLHEIGHTLGLGHGGPYNGSSTYGIDNVFTQDTWNHTVMSYHSQAEASSGTTRLVLGLQVADILAIQDLYGANGAGTRGGDTVYGANATEAGSIYDFDAWDAQGIRPPSFSIYDTGGIDTFDLSIYSTNQIINLVASGDVISSSSVGSSGGVALSNLISIAVGTVIENAIGGSGNDILIGNDVDNELKGNGGNDNIDGGDGIDYAVYNGARASYTITDNGDGTWTIMGEGTDTLSNVEFARFTDGDVALAPGGSGDINLTEGNDNYSATEGDDVINGLGGNDIINGLGGDDTLNGGDGADRLIGGSGADVLNGGAGFDSVDYRGATSRVAFNVETSGTVGDDANEFFYGEADGDTYFGIEAVYGSDFDDSLTGNNSVNELRGFDGDDMLFGLGGNDRFFGGEGADSFDGGTGTDIVNYTVATAGVTVNLVTGGTAGEALGDSFTSIEWVFGSNFGDSITGDAANNRLEGRDGDDTLNGEAGNDRLLGGDGNDIINGGDGVDTIFGQDGDDVMNGGGGNDFFFGSAGADSHDGGTGTDTVSYLASSTGVTVNMSALGTPSTGDALGDSFISIERIFGSGFDDNLIGDFNNNVLLGNGGNDYLAGGAGNDSLNGGAGIDSFGYDEVVDAADVIIGFTLNETVFIFGGTVTDYADLLTYGSDAGANVIFDFGLGNTLTIVGHNLVNLSASNFDFGGSTPAAPSPSPSTTTPDAANMFSTEMVDMFDMDALI